MFHFVQLHVPSLHNDCTIQDLWLPSLESCLRFLFPHQTQLRIMSFMTWSSKTWIQVNMIVKTWQPQVWNLTLFFQDLAWQVLNCCIATPLFQSLDIDCTIQDLASQVSTPFGLKIFNIRPLPRLISFMTWSSKTWIQWLPMWLKCHARLGEPNFDMLYIPKTWLSKSWNLSG